MVSRRVVQLLAIAALALPAARAGANDYGISHIDSSAEFSAVHRVP